MCPRCLDAEMVLNHSCPDDSSPCRQCGKSRVVVVVRQDERGTLSETQKCLHCLNKNGAK